MLARLNNQTITLLDFFHYHVGTGVVNARQAQQGLAQATGGFAIRECGLFDENGNLIYYGSLPTVIKPILPDGTGMDYVLTMRALITNEVEIVLKIDPGVVIATREYVDDEIADHDADEDAHEAAFGQHDSNPDAHAAAINKHNTDATAHAAMLAVHNADLFTFFWFWILIRLVTEN